ncbi:DUF1566 domain-containing protein [Glaciecola sp. 1036]|uniref:Lcl C-terminal domain-containing protein n=1 Tax=Alteromonadaceae TaxID=72275 RepID=UPI003D04A4AE
MKSRTLKRLCLVSFWAALAMVSMYVDAESICPAGIPETAKDEEFMLTTNGEAIHLPSNLVFMRCSFGQTWTGNNCEGEPQPLTWQEALNYAMGFEYANSKNWRLPNVKELAQITEKACVRPAINEAIFPVTSSDDYWTSSPSIQDVLRAWSVSFENGSTSLKAKDRTIFVRLVRTRLPQE